MLKLLHQAALIALPSTDTDYRDFWLGCVGIREDGVIVSAKNGAADFRASVKRHQLLPTSHAEGRLLRKLGGGGIIYVARVSKKDESLAMARPCNICQVKIRAAKTIKVYYSINETQYGVWYPDTDEDKVFKIK